MILQQDKEKEKKKKKRKEKKNQSVKKSHLLQILLRIGYSVINELG